MTTVNLLQIRKSIHHQVHTRMIWRRSIKSKYKVSQRFQGFLLPRSKGNIKSSSFRWIKFNQSHTLINFLLISIVSKNRSGSIDEKRNANLGTSNNSKSSDLSNPPAIKQPLGPNTATIYSKTSSMQKTNKQGPEIRRRQKITAWASGLHFLYFSRSKSIN